MSIVSTFLRQLYQVKQWRQPILLVGAIISLLLALAAVLISPPLQSVRAAPRLQQSPLSPLTSANEAISVTTSAAMTATTAGLITSTVVTASEPLPAEVSVITEPVAAATATAPVAVTSPLTVTPISGDALVHDGGNDDGAPVRFGRPNPLAGLWSLPARMASGQISLVLVAALFVGIFTVIGLVLTRRS